MSFRMQELPEFIERALEACTKRTSDEKRYESYLTRRPAGFACAAAGLMGAAAGGAALGGGEETLDERMMPFQRDGVRCVGSKGVQSIVLIVLHCARMIFNWMLQ